MVIIYDREEIGYGMGYEIILVRSEEAYKKGGMKFLIMSTRKKL